MKQLFSLLFAFALTLGMTACGQPPAGSSSAPSEPADLPEPTEAEVETAYWDAAEVYDWFDLASLPASGEPVTADGKPFAGEQDGIPYRRVDSPTFKTYAGLSQKVRETFSPELADQLLSGPNYLDIGGALYTAEGARGVYTGLAGRSVHAERADADRWVVTVTFYADSYDLDPSRAVIGYSRKNLDFERLDGGWRFTSFCPSDALDETADTVFTFDYADGEAFASGNYMDWEPLQLFCWLLHADGGYAQGPGDQLVLGFLNHPDAYFAAAAPLLEGPWELAEQVAEGSSYSAAAWFTEDQQTRFQEILDAYQPKDSGEQAVLDLLTATWEKALAMYTPT